MRLRGLSGARDEFHLPPSRKPSIPSRSDPRTATERTPTLGTPQGFRPLLKILRYSGPLLAQLGSRGDPLKSLLRKTGMLCVDAQGRVCPMLLKKSRNAFWRFFEKRKKTMFAD